MPGDSKAVHPLADPQRFYLNIKDIRPISPSQFNRENRYILISAGEDGLHGTPDDICNFRAEYHER